MNIDALPSGTFFFLPVILLNNALIIRLFASTCKGTRLPHPRAHWLSNIGSTWSGLPLFRQTLDAALKVKGVLLLMLYVKWRSFLYTYANQDTLVHGGLWSNSTSKTIPTSLFFAYISRPEVCCCGYRVCFFWCIFFVVTVNLVWPRCKPHSADDPCTLKQTPLIICKWYLSWNKKQTCWQTGRRGKSTSVQK